MSFACPSIIASLDPALCRAVDIYCERTSAAPDAEPVNALTNVAFLVAAWALWRIRRRAVPAARRTTIGVLVVLVALVGLGSALFHTVATRWAEWADVLPIVAFMLAYAWVAMGWLFGLGRRARLLVVLAFAALTLSLEAWVPSSVLWGGALYLPALAFVAVVCAALARRRHPAASSMAAAGATFLVAVAMRSLDTPLCGAVPVGTHFLWHLLNAAFAYQLVRLLILHGAAPVRRDGGRRIP
jgi:hypothetical protein